MVVTVTLFQQLEVRRLIGVDSRSLFHKPDDMRDDMRLGACVNNTGYDIAAALDHAQHNRLVVLSLFVLAADESFVGLDRLPGPPIGASPST